LSESLHFYPDDAKNLPIIKLTELLQQPFISVVNQILENKKDNIDTTALEAKIDIMVYKLYELTYEEVLVIEPEFSLSKQEYEAFTV
jgi:adenine-specific DNA-methyltransferase